MALAQRPQRLIGVAAAPAPRPLPPPLARHRERHHLAPRTQAGATPLGSSGGGSAESGGDETRRAFSSSSSPSSSAPLAGGGSGENDHDTNTNNIAALTALSAILARVRERDLDALLEYVPDAALDAALEQARGPASVRQQRRRAKHPPPQPLTFAHVLAASSSGLASWPSPLEDFEAAAEAEARAAAGDDGGDAVAGLIAAASAPAPPEPSSSPHRRRRPRPYFDDLAVRHLVRLSPVDARVLSSVFVSDSAFRARVAVRSSVVGGGGAEEEEEAVLTFALSRMASLEPRYRGAPRLEQRWFLTGVTGEEEEGSGL
jgi:hypothetical protein